MTLSEIREELRDIKYYYARKDFIDSSTDFTGKSKVYELINKYNKAICNAPMRMYDLYISIYKENNTQESLADAIKYSVEYVAKLNQQLVKYFQKEFKRQEVISNEQK